MAATALAAVIVVLNGLAFMPLCAAMMLFGIFAFNAPALTGAGVIAVIWVIAAWLASCTNIVIGLKAMDEPTWRRLLWLYGSSGLMLVLYPGRLFPLF